MSIPLTINGAVFEYPVDFDENWGVNATGWAQAVTNGMLQLAGGSFPLTADINFGPNFGLLSKYFETRSANPATVGTVRLSSVDAGIAWRNFANSGNNILTTDASNNLQYNGSTISGGVNAGTQFKLGYYATTSSNISANPNTMAATQVLVTDANGVPTTTGNGATTATEIGFVHGVTSALQPQFKVIQVGTPVFDTTATNVTTATWTDCGITATITPTSASNRILVLVFAEMYVSTNTGNTTVDARIVRGAATVVNTFPNILAAPTGTLTGAISAQVPMMAIDSPATTSATTYKIQIQNQTAASTGANNRGNGVPTTVMLLIEVV